MALTLRPPRPLRPGWVEHWDPEDPVFWERRGRRVARRNLLASILAEHVGFSVWLLWSAVVVYLPQAGFALTDDQRFWLLAVASLVGATARLPYTGAVTVLGGRTWTALSALLLLVPLGLMLVCVTDPTTPFWMFLLAAAASGLGGGNFASSMANISHFYPERTQGLALGVNAAGGNLGASTVQLFVPLVVGVAVVGPGLGGLHLGNVAVLWAVLALVAAGVAWCCMDNLRGARGTVRAQVGVLRRRQTWLLALLYIGTFGSFIGFSGAFPLLLQTQFPAAAGAGYAFLGPLLGSVLRPLGGWLADRYGGAVVTAGTFVLLGAGVGGVLLALSAGSIGLFLTGFLVLFVLTGVGNGATYRMVPVVFRREALRRRGDTAQARAEGARESAAAIGVIAAIGAYGGFLVQRAFGASTAATGGIGAALLGFLVFYALCVALTWWCYVRPAADAVAPAPAVDPVADGEPGTAGSRAVDADDEPAAPRVLV